MATKTPWPSLARRKPSTPGSSSGQRRVALGPRWRRGLFALVLMSLLVGFAGFDAAQPSVSSASTAPTPRAFDSIQPVGTTAGTWAKRIFDSEFNGSSLVGSRWTTGWGGTGITEDPNGNAQDCYDPSQVSMARGHLDLTAIAQTETCNDTSQPFTSGAVTTDGRFSFTYGYMEARIWMPAGTNGIADWPAFWADGQNWPKTGEIDTVEGLSGAACYHFINLDLVSNLPSARGSCASGSFGGGWHTFAADWEAGSVTYYYDGTEVWRDTTGITGKPMYLVLDLAVPNATEAPGITPVIPATVRVDYVRVWQH